LLNPIRLRPWFDLDHVNFTAHAVFETQEVPPYGILGGAMETSASFEARYAPLLYPTDHLPRPAISLVQQARYRALAPPAGGNVFATVWDYPIRGLNKNHSHDLKNIFKGAAIRAAAVTGPFQDFHAALVAKGLQPPKAMNEGQ
jgi:hypothetical protein